GGAAPRAHLTGGGGHDPPAPRRRRVPPDRRRGHRPPRRTRHALHGHIRRGPRLRAVVPESGGLGQAAAGAGRRGERRTTVRRPAPDRRRGRRRGPAPRPGRTPRPDRGLPRHRPRADAVATPDLAPRRAGPASRTGTLDRSGRVTRRRALQPPRPRGRRRSGAPRLRPGPPDAPDHHLARSLRTLLDADRQHVPVSDVQVVPDLLGNRDPAAHPYIDVAVI